MRNRYKEQDDFFQMFAEYLFSFMPPLRQIRHIWNPLTYYVSCFCVTVAITPGRSILS